MFTIFFEVVVRIPETIILYILKHIDLTADQAVINEVILICADDQHVLRDFVRYGFQVV